MWYPTNNSCKQVTEFANLDHLFTRFDFDNDLRPAQQRWIGLHQIRIRVRILRVLGAESESRYQIPSPPVTALLNVNYD